MIYLLSILILSLVFQGCDYIIQLKGRVLSNENGEPISGAQVTLKSRNITVAVQPATGLEVGVDASTPRYASFTRGYSWLPPFGGLLQNRFRHLNNLSAEVSNFDCFYAQVGNLREWDLQIFIAFVCNVKNFIYICIFKIYNNNLTVKNMPVISDFLGIVIYMYFNEHNPPHFHAKYNEFRAEILIETLAVKEGKLPPRILGLVTEWAELRKEELLENWISLKKTGEHKRIQPLI